MIFRLALCAFSFLAIQTSWIAGADEKVQQAIEKLNKVLADTGTFQFAPSDFNEKGLAILRTNAESSVDQIVEGIDGGYSDDLDLNTYLTGNNQNVSSWWGPAYGYTNTMKALNTIKFMLHSRPSTVADADSTLTTIRHVDTLRAGTASPSPLKAAAIADSIDTSHQSISLSTGSAETDFLATTTGTAISADALTDTPLPEPTAAHESPRMDLLTSTSGTTSILEHPVTPSSPRPYPLRKKIAAGTGVVFSAAAVGWLASLLADKDTREQLALFFRTMVFKKARLTASQRTRHMRNSIKRSGGEALGAAALLAAGIGGIVYGYRKP